MPYVRSILILSSHYVIEQFRSSGNASGLYSDGTWFEYRYRQYPEILQFSPGKCSIRSSKQATVSSTTVPVHFCHPVIQRYVFCATANTQDPPKLSSPRVLPITVLYTEPSFYMTNVVCHFPPIRACRRSE